MRLIRREFKWWLDNIATDCIFSYAKEQIAISSRLLGIFLTSI